jgi:hypothetical protein
MRVWLRAKIDFESRLTLLNDTFFQMDLKTLVYAVVNSVMGSIMNTLLYLTIT